MCYLYHAVLTQKLLIVFSRLAKYQAFKNFNKRILVATDLFGRGMDIERVNIVVNYDMPEDSDSYLHRVSSDVLTDDTSLCSLQVARAGRFGTKGLAITFVSEENDAKVLNSVQDRHEVNITELPDEIKVTLYSDPCTLYYHYLEEVLRICS